MDFFIQAIGFVAIAFNLFAVQFNSHNAIVWFKTIGSFLFGVQYFLLKLFTGVVMEIVGWIRNIVFIQLVKRGKDTKPWIFFFSVITVITGVISTVLSWEKSLDAVAWITKDYIFSIILTVGISLLSVFAKVLSTIAYGINDAHKIRMLNIPTSSCWVVYNFIGFSLAGICNELMTLFSITIAEIRYKKLKKTKTEIEIVENEKSST